MQALCMPLLNKIPSNLISDVSPDTTMLFMNLWGGGSHKPHYGAAYGVIEGLDLPIAMFFFPQMSGAQVSLVLISVIEGVDACLVG